MLRLTSRPPAQALPLPRPTLPQDREQPPTAARKKGGGKRRGKSPAWKANPFVAEATPPTVAPPSAAAPPPPAVSLTSSGGDPPTAPRAYAQVAAAVPPRATSSAPTAASSSIPGGRGPFPTLTRRHSVRCLLVAASPHVETYVGASAVVAASKMYGKVVFFLASETAAQEAVERGLVVGGVHVPLEPLEDLGVRVVLTSVPPFLPNAAPLPSLSTLGKPISVISPLPLGCKDPALCHVWSFCRQVQLQMLPVVRGGAVLKGSFQVPYQGALYRVHYSTGEARCFPLVVWPLQLGEVWGCPRSCGVRASRYSSQGGAHSRVLLGEWVTQIGKLRQTAEAMYLGS